MTVAFETGAPCSFVTCTATFPAFGTSTVTLPFASVAPEPTVTVGDGVVPDISVDGAEEFVVVDWLVEDVGEVGVFDDPHEYRVRTTAPITAACVRRRIRPIVFISGAFQNLW
jgi:hypothetical protein